MYNSLLKLLLFLISIVLSITATVNAQSESDAYQVKSFQTNSSPSVNISTSGGFVNVYGHDANEVKVVMYARSNNQYLSPSDNELSDFDIIISQSGNEITATAQRESSVRSGFFRRDNNISISFEVYVPVQSVVDGRTSGGSVKAENILNNLNLRTSGGSVNATNVHGNSELRTSGGSIRLEDMSGRISARTSGGSVRVNGLEGEADIRTSGGSIRIENSGAKLSARTSGGSINAAFHSFRDDIELRTSGGSIQITIPEIEHFNLDLTGNRVNTQLRNFTGTSERNKISGRIGDGGPSVVARTSGGSVTLSYIK